MRNLFKATNVVLMLLCVMYFITYVDRVNVSTAASAFQKELHLDNTQLGLIFSAFAYPYLLFQIAGGYIGDRFGPRMTLLVCGGIWAGATILTGFAEGFVSLFAVRMLLGFGEGATFPTATRAFQDWLPASKRGFAQGLTHSSARLGGAATPTAVAMLMAAVTWRGSFIVLGFVSLIWVVVWVWYFRDDPKTHRSITAEELTLLPVRSRVKRGPIPWGRLARRMAPVTLTYFCYGWCLWLYLNWLPLFFKNNYHMEIKNSALFASGVFFAGVVGDTLGGVISDAILKRTGNLRYARIGVTFVGFMGALLCLMPIFFVTDITTVALCLSGGFFFAEITIGPMWAIPMDFAPKYSGTAAGLMNTGSALAAIVSPLIAGFVIDKTGNWYLPFLMSIALLALGAVTCFFMHPERPFDDEPTVPLPAGRTVPAR
ncbi:MFS transporter [Beijerinckia sp. L45]|uniref:MFS transporter n=1 Tax=Beijerinckia sp. L45 TaxID=1641855 RepID=UPI00131B23B8|nr:MFS transporter [Beijerinckia sp. L45]